VLRNIFTAAGVTLLLFGMILAFAGIIRNAGEAAEIGTIAFFSGMFLFLFSRMSPKPSEVQPHKQNQFKIEIIHRYSLIWNIAKLVGIASNERVNLTAYWLAVAYARC
jgi:hypothetical protein